jgi:hypothetical protein
MERMLMAKAHHLMGLRLLLLAEKVVFLAVALALVEHIAVLAFLVVRVAKVVGVETVAVAVRLDIPEMAVPVLQLLVTLVVMALVVAAVVADQV